MIRVLLAEDQGMMRGALALLLDLEDDIEVVAKVASGDRVVAEALASRPDVALLDIEMPGRSGLDVAGDLKAVTHLDRPFLHAARLAFKHPSDGRRMAFESALPDDLQRVLDELRGKDEELEEDE